RCWSWCSRQRAATDRPPYRPPLPVRTARGAPAARRATAVRRRHGDPHHVSTGNPSRPKRRRTRTMAAITAPLDGPEQTRTTTAPTVAMFPGQGSQRAGMAAHLLESHADTTTPVFAAADEAAG